ncbi:MAG: ribokinase [Oscillatoriales cyanobacterium]|nr:MAG: ribokinase [Oscillatoriales cyanobacterium]
MGTIWVLGSINADRTVTVDRLPRVGETVLGGAIAIAGGGKGANQAAAAARLGAKTHLIGRVGSDPTGAELLAALRSQGVAVAGVAIDPDAPTGQAWIVVDAAGQNQIIVIPGANGCVGPSEIDRLQTALATTPGPHLLLLQLEIPLATVLAAAQAGRAAGAIVLLDPAPARRDWPSELWSAIDWLSPNGPEASQLAGFPVVDRPTAEQAAADLQAFGAKGVIITLGDQGAWIAGPDEAFWQPAFTVESIDSVAAGDAFNGAWAAALAEGRSIREAARWAAAAGALCCQRSGAQPALPTRSALDTLLAAQPGS